MTDDRRQAHHPDDDRHVRRPGPGSHPPLRDRLDHELAHLDATPQARRRLQEATAGAAPHRRRMVASGARWTGPLAAAAVAAVAVAVPVAMQQLRRPGPTPPAATTGIPAAPTGATPPRSGSPSGSPVPAPSTSPRQSPVPGPGTPSPARASRARLVVVPTSRVVAAGSELDVLVSVSVSVATDAGPAATDAGPVTRKPTSSPGPAAGPSTTMVVLRWGDGQQSSERLRCVDGTLPEPQRLPFAHTYRRAGSYDITATVSPSGACAVSGASTTVRVAVRSR